MKPITITSFILFLLISCNSQKEINVLFENNKTIEYSMKKLDTFHKHKCKTEKFTDIKTQVRFKLCNEYFITQKDSNLIKQVTDQDVQQSNPISLKQFIEEYSHLRGADKKIKVFFIEKNTDNTYLKYQVKWSKDFIEYEPSQKGFEKF
jgi:hypothetical protein